MTRLLLAMIIIVAAVARPVDAIAENGLTPVDEEAPEPMYLAELRPGARKIIGFDFGIGLFDGFCAECRLQGGVSTDFFIGVQLARRVAVVVDLWSLLHLLPSDAPDERGLTAHSMATASGRVWLTPTYWLQGGVGGGFLSVIGPTNDVAVGPGAVVVVGSELRHRPDRGVDLSVRLGTSRFRIDGAIRYIYNASAVVGYHWN